MAETAAAVPPSGATEDGFAAPGTLVSRFVPSLALFVSIVSTVALALYLASALGPLWPSIILQSSRVEWVIPPGHEAEIFRLVVHGADDEIPKTERPSIASIEAIGPILVIAFDGDPEGEGLTQPQKREVTIRVAESPGDAFVRTNAFAATWSGDHVPESIRRYISAIAKAPGWHEVWVPPGYAGPVRAFISEPAAWILLLWALIAGNTAATVLLIFANRQQGPSADDRGDASRAPRLSPLAALTVLMAFSVAVFALAHFQFRLCDYQLLAATHDTPKMAGVPLQVLSTMVHYRVGVFLGGGNRWFAASNLGFLGAICTCWGLLLYRMGFSRDASVIAGALLAMGPGTFFLLRWGDGVEHLSATACLMLVLLLTDLAARETARRRAWRYAVLIIALCLSALGLLMKFALIVVLPPSCWLWGRWLVRRPAAPMERSVTYLAFFAVVGGAILILPAGETGAIGFLPSHFALAAIGDRLWRYTAAAVCLALGAMWGAQRSRFGNVEPYGTSVEAPSHGRLGSRLDGALHAAAAGLSSTAGVLRMRVGRLPLMVWALVVSALWFLPFALHAEYEGWTYYGFLASAPLCAVGALLISTAADQWRVHGWQRVVGACVACAILLPAADIRSDLRQSATELLPPWLDDVHALAASRSRPERIVVAPTCPQSANEIPLSRQMEAIWSERGIWWATGWYDVPVEFRNDPLSAETRGGSAANVVTFGYCPGRPATIE